jgi:chromosome segregation ATPase
METVTKDYAERYMQSFRKHLENLNPDTITNKQVAELEQLRKKDAQYGLNAAAIRKAQEKVEHWKARGKSAIDELCKAQDKLRGVTDEKNALIGDLERQNEALKKQVKDLKQEIASLHLEAGATDGSPSISLALVGFLLGAGVATIIHIFL